MIRSLWSTRSIACRRVFSPPIATNFHPIRGFAAFSGRLNSHPLSDIIRVATPVGAATEIHTAGKSLESDLTEQSIESYVRTIRDKWGNDLPEGLLSHQQYEIYERYYGPPLRRLSPEDIKEMEELELAGLDAEDAMLAAVTVTLEDVDGVEIDHDFEAQELTEDELQEEVRGGTIRARTEKEAAMYLRIGEDIRISHRFADNAEGTTLELADEFDEDSSEDVEPRLRTHPLTKLGRFGTFPTTVISPESIQRPTAALFSAVSNRHLDQAAHKLLGGSSLPHSPIMTSRSSKTYTGIPMDTSRGMTDMEANVHLATVLPGYYAQTLSILTELRRRLGGDWILGRENGNEPRVKQVLDIGTGGAGILAWRAMVEAEKELRDEAAAEVDVEAIKVDTEATEVDEEATEVDEEATEIGVRIPEPAEETAPLKAVAVVGSYALRVRMSKYLENTIFISRLPDVVADTIAPINPIGSPEPAGKQPQKLYDLIIATNTVLPVFESHKRKAHVQNLWSLLNPKGGVLVIIEKGSPKGFEAVAGARKNILKQNISTPGSEFVPLTEADEVSDPRSPKEVASIIAPCTNHSECPLYINGPGKSMRRDYCSFVQRYERPGYLQRVLDAKTRNHEDLRYSYIAVRRGVDVSLHETPINPQIEDFDTSVTPPRSPYSMDQLRAHAYTLPRVVFPPLKRQGHVILDVCTAQAKIERWTVPRSFGKVAFRDARKSQWGDLWALGAKTQIPRNLDLGEKIPRVRKKVERIVDFGEGEVKEAEKELDKPGGKKKNPGKRERERRAVKREAQKKRAVQKGEIREIAAKFK